MDWFEGFKGEKDKQNQSADVTKFDRLKKKQLIQNVFEPLRDVKWLQ